MEVSGFYLSKDQDTGFSFYMRECVYRQSPNLEEPTRDMTWVLGAGKIWIVDLAAGSQSQAASSQPSDLYVVVLHEASSGVFLGRVQISSLAEESCGLTTVATL